MISFFPFSYVGIRVTSQPAYGYHDSYWAGRQKKNKGVNDTYVEGIRDEHGNAEDDVRGFWYRFLFLVHDTKARSSSESSLGGIAIPFMGMLRY